MLARPPKDFWTAIVLPLLILALVLAGVRTYAYVSSRNIVRDNTAKNLAVIAKLKVGQIEQWQAERIDDAQLIVTHQFSTDLRQWLAGGGSNRQLEQRLNSQLAFMGTSRYTDISLRSAVDGRLLLTANHHPDLEATRNQALACARDGEPIIEDIHRGPIATDPAASIGLFYPVRDSVNGKVLAVLHLTADPSAQLFPLLQRWPDDSVSAETLLVRREGEEAVYLNQLRHTLAAPLEVHRPLTMPKLLAPQVFTNGNGFYEGSDYRGVSSLAYGRAVAGTPWYLIAKIDRDEVYAGLDIIMAYASAVFGLMLVASAWWLVKRRQREELLRAALAESEDLYQNASCGYLSLGSDGAVLRINDTGLRMLGYRREELVGKPIQALLTAESQGRFWRNYSLFVATGEVQDREFEFHRKDGTLLAALVDGTAIRDKDGCYLMSRTTLHDITERKKAEAALRDSEARLKRAQLIARLYDWRWDVASGEVESFGPRDEILNMYPGFTANTTFQMWMASMAAIGHEHVAEIMKKARANRESFEFEIRIKREPQPERIFLTHGEPEIGADGDVKFFHGTTQDITQSKRHELEAIRSREQLRALASHQERLLEEERKRIAREIHDELGQQLTTLKLNIGMLRLAHGDNPDILQRAQLMRENVDRSIDVVRQVSRNLRPAALNLGIVAATEWLAGEFTDHWGIDCEIDSNGCDIELEDMQAIAVFRVVQESLTNVVRHSGAKHVSIVLRRQQEEFTLRVHDDGRGFDVGTASTNGGYGLIGMRERISALGGTIDFESSPSAGTTVAISFPLPPRDPEKLNQDKPLHADAASGQ